MKFITFEGIDGCGKTSLVAEVAKLLQKEYGDEYTIVAVNDPSTITPELEALREEILTNEHSVKEKLFLFVSARKLLETYIKENFNTDKHIVLCDRYYHSTYAYQGYGMQIPKHEIDEIHRQLMVDMNFVDHTFFIDIPLSVAFERIESRRGKKDVMEKMGLPFFVRVNMGFSRIRKQCGDSATTVNGETPLLQLAQEVADDLRDRFIEQS